MADEISTIRDFEDVFLGSRSEFESWRADFEREFIEPQVEQTALVMWAKLPEPLRAEMRRRNPEQMQLLDKLLSGGKYVEEGRRNPTMAPETPRS